MKTTILKTLVLSLLITTFFSCNKDDDSPNPNNENYYLKVKIDGVDFSVSDAKVSVNPDQTDSLYTITALDATINTITLTLVSPTSEGTFITSLEEEFPALSYTQTSPFAVWAATENVGSGTITITENNATYMEGTFSFTGINPADGTIKTFTEGSFKAEKL